MYRSSKGESGWTACLYSVRRWGTDKPATGARSQRGRADCWADLAVGSRLLCYRIERLLGRGAMGVVYVADDLRLRRSVALKVLSPSLAADESFRNRFLAESKLAASLDHPCVVPIYEASEVDGQPFIVMRFVEGSDLKTLLRGGPLAADRAVRLCAQVADALDFAHERRSGSLVRGLGVLVFAARRGAR